MAPPQGRFSATAWQLRGIFIMAQQAKRLQPCEVIEGQLEEAPVVAPVNALEASIAASAAHSPWIFR